MEGIHEAASQPGGTSADVWAGWDQAAHPVYGKTGTAAAPRPGRPVLVHVLRRRPQAPDRDRGDGRAGRLRRRNGGADRAPDGLAVVRVKARSSSPGARRRSDASSARSSADHAAPEQPPAAAAAHAAAAARPADDARRARPRGLLAGHARRGDHATSSPATRTTTSTARRSTWRRRSSLMVVLSRLDYARLRPLQKRHLRGCCSSAILAVLGLGHTARGSQRAINFPLFSFQASELGKVLLILALSALVVDRARRLRERDTTIRVMIAALVPAMLRDRPAGPRLGHGLHGDRLHAAVRRGHARGATSRRSLALVLRGARVRARRGPRGGRQRAQALPGASA